jgi:hypothetical protein
MVLYQPTANQPTNPKENLMKILVNEVENEGLESLLGKTVVLWCGVYIYTGRLVGINSTCVKLDSAKVVYETGPHGDTRFKDVQSVTNGTAWYVMTQSIESFGETHKV